MRWRDNACCPELPMCGQKITCDLTFATGGSTEHFFWAFTICLHTKPGGGAPRASLGHSEGKQGRIRSPGRQETATEVSPWDSCVYGFMWRTERWVIPPTGCKCGRVQRKTFLQVAWELTVCTVSWCCFGLEHLEAVWQSNLQRFQKASRLKNFDCVSKRMVCTLIE